MTGDRPYSFWLTLKEEFVKGYVRGKGEGATEVITRSDLWRVRMHLENALPFNT